MTADIRTAAQREAENRWGKSDPAVIHPSAFDQMDERMRREFVTGYLAGAARVTPTREQIAEALGKAYSSSPYRDAHLRGADVVLTLMQELAEGEKA